VPIFPEKPCPSSRLAEGSLNTIARHLMAQLLPLLEPRAVKMASVIGARLSRVCMRRLSESMQTQSFLMQLLISAGVVLFWLYEGVFAIFVSIDG
jgi:hypothetical protein